MAAGNSVRVERGELKELPFAITDEQSESGDCVTACGFEGDTDGMFDEVAGTSIFAEFADEGCG